VVLPALRKKKFWFFDLNFKRNLNLFLFFIWFWKKGGFLVFRTIIIWQKNWVRKTPIFQGKKKNLKGKKGQLKTI